MKIVWLVAALLGISIWYIPNTVSLFSGQHSFYNLDANGSQVPCIKCHGDIDMEIHTGFIHNNFTCSDCHRIQKGVQYASGDGANSSTPGTMAHAASTVLCKDCHREYLNNTPDPIHQAFIRYGAEHDTNENCIACHTSTAVSIKWTRPSAINIETISDGSNISLNGTRKTFMTRIETFGNQSGDVIAVSNVTVI
jgi:hypothetical protein